MMMRLKKLGWGYLKDKKGSTAMTVGLLLPAGVAEKEDVRGGTVVAIGPGMPLPPPTSRSASSDGKWSGTGA